MREARIIMPDAGAISRPYEFRVAKKFGGLTMTRCKGTWIDPETGHRHIDQNVAYDVAMEPSPANDAWLDDLAVDWGVATGQICVYVRHASGEVVILDCADDGR